MANSNELSSQSFDIGRVISGTFSAIAKNFVVFLGGAVVFLGLPQALSIYGALDALGGADLAGNNAVLNLVALALNLIGSSIMSGYIVYTVAQGYRGHEPSIGESYSAAIRSILGLIGASILISLGVVLGAILLFVPGVIFMIMWSVTIPALVVEGLSPVGAMKRSQELTKGSRWPIFWLSLVGLLINFALVFAVSGFSVNVFVAAQPGLAVLAGQALVTIATSILFGTGSAIAYAELRNIKEGIGTEQLASVFD
jgi:hypothetical protein